MKKRSAFSKADSDGAPMLKGVVVPARRGGVFTGWHHIQRKDEAFEIDIHHGLGTDLCTLDYWFWAGGGVPNHMRRWSGKMPHPDEAGPARIFTTRNWIYFAFEGDKPIFADFDLPSGTYNLMDEGWIGALLTPA